MSLTDNINRLASTFVDMLQTRLELVSVELEEELTRFSTYFIYALVALYCAGVAVSLGIFLVIAMFWDEHRIAVLLWLIGLFGAISIFISARLRKQFLNKPRLLEQSIAELKKDTELIRRRDAKTEQEQP
jgi:uncharacterized membrane protein YqjE